MIKSIYLCNEWNKNKQYTPLNGVDGLYYPVVPYNGNNYVANKEHLPKIGITPDKDNAGWSIFSLLSKLQQNSYAFIGDMKKDKPITTGDINFEECKLESTEDIIIDKSGVIKFLISHKKYIFEANFEIIAKNASGFLTWTLTNCTVNGIFSINIQNDNLLHHHYCLRAIVEPREDNSTMKFVAQGVTGEITIQFGNIIFKSI